MGKIIDKNKIAIILSVLLAACVLMNHSKASAALPEGELFEKAYGYYLSYHPDKALESFDIFLKEYPESSAKDSALFWKAKSLLQLNRKKEAITIFEEIRAIYTDSYFRGFAEKEIEDDRKSALVTTEAAPAVAKRPESLSGGDATSYETRSKALEDDKKVLENQLAELNKKIQVTEKGLSKTLEDRDKLQGLLEQERKRNEDLARGTDNSLDKALTENRKLLEEKKTVETKLKESDEKLRALGAEKDRSTQQLNTAAIEREEALARVRALESREKELNLVLNGLQDKQKDWKELDLYIKQLNNEKLNLENQAKERNSKLADAEKSVHALQNKIKEIENAGEKDRKDVNETITKLSSEKATLQEALKNEQKRVSELAGQGTKQEALLKEIETLRDSRRTLEADAEKEKSKMQSELLLTQERNESLQKSIKENESREKEIKELTQRVQEQEKKVKESERLARNLTEDRDKLQGLLEQERKRNEDLARGTDNSLDKALTENRKLLEEKKTVETKLKESDEKLRALGESLFNERKKVAEYESGAKEYKDLLAQTNERKTEQSLPSRVSKEHDIPVLRIGKTEYSQRQVIDSTINSMKVLSKLNVEPVIWRGSNAYDNFIVEEILSSKAKDIGVEGLKSKYDSLVRQHSFNQKEQEYLAKYLRIESFIALKFGAKTADEKEIKAYYETNKNEFLAVSEERTVRLLSLHFSKKDELEKAMAAIEFRNEAVSGKPLERIYSARPDILVFRQMGYSELPDWIKKTTSDLQDNEISNVISTADQFMIMQISIAKPVYQNYSEARPEIQKRLSLKQKIDYYKMMKFINEIKKEAFEIR